MSKKLILFGIFVILVLAIPATSAQEITKSFDYTFECPVNNTVTNGIYFYNSTDYAFDNFTLSYVDIEISSNAYLLINIYEQVRGTDYNLSWYPVFTGVTNYCRLDVFDLGLDDEVFNATKHPYWSRSSTQEINGTTYSVILPYYLLELENVDSINAVIQVDYTIAVETHGDREAEVIITPRNSTGYFFPPIDDYFYLENSQVQSLVIGLLLTAVALDALRILVSKWQRSKKQ
ncbi:MAG: hypothetical protein ACTSPB_15550 [Candidatus Thorarchaeota archaeon]